MRGLDLSEVYTDEQDDVKASVRFGSAATVGTPKDLGRSRGCVLPGARCNADWPRGCCAHFMENEFCELCFAIHSVPEHSYAVQFVMTEGARLEEGHWPRAFQPQFNHRSQRASILRSRRCACLSGTSVRVSSCAQPSAALFVAKQSNAIPT